MDIPYKQEKEAYPYRVTQKLRGAFALGDQPSLLLLNWQGYFRNTDPTILPPNSLTFPSINCFIPNKDKIVPRLGTTLLGQEFTTDKSWPIVGHKKRFSTMGGYEIEVRVTKTDDTNLSDLIEVYYPNPATGISQWYPITQNPNPFPTGPHRYYFDDWFDTNVNPARSLNLSRLIWVNGLPNIFSWTGGIAPIVSIVANTSISTTPGVTWASLGFPDSSISGFTYIVIRGTSYTITGGWNTNTLTLTNTTGIVLNDVAFSPILSTALPPTAEITFVTYTGTFKIGETITGGTSGATGIISSISGNSLTLETLIGAFQIGETVTGGTSGATAVILTYRVIPPPVFDVCRQNKNYMFYGSWNSRKLYMSNGFSHDPTQEITTSQAVQNDLVLNLTNQYTGTGFHVYRVTIDSVSPDVNTQTFTGTGINDARFDVSGYSGPLNALNHYSVIDVADYKIQYSGLSGTFSIGEIVSGATVNDLAQVVYQDPSNPIIALIYISGSIASGDTITGASSGATATVSSSFFQDWIQFYKNGVLVPFAGNNTVDVSPGTYVFSDGISIAFSNTTGHSVGSLWQLDYETGGIDTFQWQIDGGTPIATQVSITGLQQTLNDNVTISFTSKNGHTLGDYWEITVGQGVINAWANFYYTLPIRKPGEGYIYSLPSNFWAMAPQEEQMYVNTQYGYWSYVSTVLSADLQSETVSLTPLKQASSSKVLFPYMMSYLEDYIIYVTTDKKLDMIGRQKLLQLPQTRSLSQPVALDFQEASFEDGSMEYWDQRLWITSPKESIMLCYDNQPTNKYWQPPQVIPENGILSIINNTLITHSNIRNQSFNLFTGITGDLGGTYTVRARSAYFSNGNRWAFKNSNKSFVEGYVSGLPPINLNVYLGISGCGGVKGHAVEPIICVMPDQAPFGEGNFGSHQHGSDIFQSDSHFYEIYPKFKPILTYRFAALELECTTTNHSYSYLSVGLNEVVANRGNMDLLNKEVISKV